MEFDVDAAYSNANVVVLGAAGFIGRWVARALSGHSARLSLVVLNKSEAEPVFARYGIRGDVIEADLGNLAGVRALIGTLRPSIVFNLAGYGVNPSERDERIAYRINAELVETLCDALTAFRDSSWHGRQLVHVGSALEYGAVGGDLSEDSVTAPDTLYGKSKLAGTMVLAERCSRDGVNGVTARLFTVFGPGEHDGRLLPSLRECARTGRRLELTSGAQRRDFTYVEDIAEGLLRLGVSRAPVNIVNLATGRLTSVRDFVLKAAALLGIAETLLDFGALPTRAEEMQHDPVNTTRIRELLDWIPPTEIETGLRRTIDWQ